MRPSWGKRYGEVIRPGGLLICLAFPIGEAVRGSDVRTFSVSSPAGCCPPSDGDREGGPPFSVSEEAYDAALPDFE